MSWLLDADVLSQPVKKHGNRAVIAWLEREQAESYTSAVVIAQVAYWIRTKEGRSREKLQAWLSRSIDALEGRILSFNTTVAHVWADQKSELENAGLPMPVEDSLIAAIFEADSKKEQLHHGGFPCRTSHFHAALC